MFTEGVSREVMPLLGLLIKFCGAPPCSYFFLAGLEINPRELKTAKPPPPWVPEHCRQEAAVLISTYQYYDLEIDSAMLNF